MKGFQKGNRPCMAMPASTTSATSTPSLFTVSAAAKELYKKNQRDSGIKAKNETVTHRVIYRRAHDARLPIRQPHSF